MKARGQATGARINMQPLMSQIVFAPNSSPWREQNACGMISAKMTMSTVDRMSPALMGETIQYVMSYSFLVYASDFDSTGHDEWT